MNKSGLANRIIPLSCVLLLACSPSQQNLRPEATTQIDPDIMVMSGLENSQAPSSTLAVKPMTLEELSSCATRKKDLKSSITQYTITKVQFAKKKAELNQKKRTLDSQRLTMNANNAKQLLDFNKRLKQQSAAVNQFNADIDAFNDKVSEQNQRSDDFNIFCAERSYRKSDLARLSPDLLFAIEEKAEQPDKPSLKDTLFTDDSSLMRTNPD